MEPFRPFLRLYLHTRFGFAKSNIIFVRCESQLTGSSRANTYERTQLHK